MAPKHSEMLENTGPEKALNRPSNGAVGQSMGHPADVEAALAAAMTAAVTVGRFDVVVQLAKELEARRLARLGNVVSIDSAKRSGR